jgi:uncharacterized membrane protein
MKERVQEQINHDLKQASRTDRLIIIIDIVLTLIMFIIALSFAYNSVGFNISILSAGGSTRTLSAYSTLIMFISLAAIIIINGYSIIALLKNKAQRSKLTDGLMKLYKEEGMDQYYDSSTLKSHETRYNVLAVILATLGAVTVILPLTIFVHQLVTNL